MADATTPDALDETLGRLSKKQGVKAALALDRATGAILKTSGQVASLRNPRPDGPAGLPTQVTGSLAGDASSAVAGGVDEFAARIWALVKAFGSLVEELDGEDEPRLLRLRSKKQELVIVPDPKYLLIVVHDTPPA